MRTKHQLSQHLKAAALLEQVFEQTYLFLWKSKWLTELDLQLFIINQLSSRNLTMDKDKPIVAFHWSTWYIHYFPHEQENPKKLTDNTLVLLDIRARLDEDDSPYADVTHMAYVWNDISEEILDIVSSTFEIRDGVVEHLAAELARGVLPTWIQIQNKTLELLAAQWYEGRMQHSVWHSIGFNSPHWTLPHLNSKNPLSLLTNVAYTIEPWIYFQDLYWARSEINFYINDNLELVVTTPMQKEIRMIQ